jgi:hypothetical protein
LINEKSPYLLQHAFNPVNWMPWGDEAFARAQRENKIIFLSIGYSTCHWCHVMAHESFENAEIAAFLNKHFICIKVDREERPDIDRIYMTATQALALYLHQGRQGGTPGHRSDLYDSHPGLDRQRRLAHVCFHAAGQAAFLCRNVLPSTLQIWQTRVS